MSVEGLESIKVTMKELRELSIKRSSVKGQITKFRNYIHNVSQERELTSIELAELSLKLGKFEALSLKFDDLQSAIEVLNYENLDKEVDEREGIEHEFVVCIAQAKRIIEDYNKLECSHRRESSSHDASGQCPHDDRESGMGVKLPQIQISKFDGAYFRWLEFHDTFESLIHNNNRITPIHKFHYLVSYLEGEAARIISNLEMSSKNYTEAWKLLCDRYDNKRILTNHHLSSLFSVQPLLRESEKSLRFLVDLVTKNLRALSSLGQPTDKWDTLLIFMLTSKLDSVTLTKWEEYRNALEEMPTLHQFNKFLTDRADVLESINRNKYIISSNNSPRSPPNASVSRPNVTPSSSNYINKGRGSYTKSFTVSSQRTNLYLCIICGDNHRIYDCTVFKSKNIQERLADVKKYKLCPNCLRQGHPLNQCHMGPCRECNQRHNSLLHDPKVSVSNTTVSETSFETTSCFSKQSENQILLSTALIEVSNPITDQTVMVRALLDSGSQTTFVTKSLTKRLTLKSTPIESLKVIGIGNNCTNHVVESCTVNIKSLNTKYKVQLSCLVLNELTSKLPKARVDIRSLNLPKDIILADPTFFQPSSIDVLIGADLFWDLLESEQLSLGPQNTKLHNSKFGWLISGPISVTKHTYGDVQCNHASVLQNSSDEVNKMLPIFWNLEEVPHKAILSKSDKFCEKHFSLTTSRLENGRFRVKLPLIDSPECLGDTYALAKKRFLSLERKFKRNPRLKWEYSEFIREYDKLGHLSECSVKPDISYFLCHHAVYKETSESTKLRVVFDGSAPSSSGYSLNDILVVGPNVQDSLFSILIRSRQHKYLLTADVEKMYRQVEVSDDDKSLQLILWREDESQPIRILKLNTLTYGTASASYLSTRCIHQLGEECDDDVIKTIIQRDMYIDDLVYSCEDPTQLRYVQAEISKVLKSGCFNLRKYKSNLPCLLQNSSHENSSTQENLIFSESSNTLGLGWKPSNDKLHFPTKDIPQSVPVTKRFIMSQSFKIFDPLGLLSPYVIQAKMLLQKLWCHKLDWDQCVPQDVEEAWNMFAKNMPFLKGLEIPRHVLCAQPIHVEMHTFSDASQLAYGACVYMRSVASNGDITTRLLCAKSKVAPLKPTTIPRLELCAALLATRLCKSVTEALRYSPARTVHWCDSSIVLAWIHNDPKKLKTFVANRIMEITDTTDPSSWRYVPTAANPADMISRGINAGQLVSMNFWWSGPDFLTKEESEWPMLNNKYKENVEFIEIKSNAITTSESLINFQSYSKLTKLKRVLAYVKRFINNTRKSNNKRTGHLSVAELDESFYLLCSIAQRQSFVDEYERLIQNKPLHSKSKLLPLSPFLDKDNLIRVGGRISASDYAYEKKHPVMLHASHRLTKLIFEHEHMRNMHAGPQLLLATIRETVWPVSGRRLARRVVNNCTRCRRLVGRTLCPKMGHLPTQRITPDHPFMSIGLDFAGPFYILNRKGRGSRVLKCYMCLFVCLRYKCLHLEAVSDLSKDAFMMTLRRFVARRGKPREIFCDNGGNFVAAAKEISNFLKQNSESLSDSASQEGIKFVFSPSYAPHFGGIWEAGVKSAKHHIRRVMGNSHLTFEELLTLFAQVEAILNSRPLCPMSSNPNDLLPLSPGHFLIGRPLTALPSPNLTDLKECSLRRYERIERLRQHFWSRWQKEYIGELQQRSKWRTNTHKLRVGDMVLIQEDHVPPLNWRLGRVSRLFPGPDGIIRVADITTVKGCMRRPLVRICPMPTEEDING